MKTFKSIAQILLLMLCLLLGIIGCSSSNESDTGEYSFPVPNITLNGQTLELAAVKNNTLETDFSILIEDSEPSKASVGDTIKIEFPNDVPISTSISSTLLDINGSLKFDDNTANSIDYSKDENVITFYIDNNPHIMHSSETNSNKNNNNSIGFKVLSEFGSYNMEYTFILEIENSI